MFQSSLELSPECNHSGNSTRAACLGFNPHSSFRPSATNYNFWYGNAVEGVSILTRAFARVQRRAGSQGVKGIQVSILTRAFARVQRDIALVLGWLVGFQSSLELSPECNLFSGANSQKSLSVSILTRAFARVQRPQRKRVCLPQTCFNPHSSFRPSATGWPRTPHALAQSLSFNPHSSFRPSATFNWGIS